MCAFFVFDLSFDSLQKGCFLFKPINHHTFYTMKSEDIALSKYRHGDSSTRIFLDLNAGVGLAIIKRWCQMIRQFGSIKLSSPSGHPRIMRTNENIRKLKNRLCCQGRVSARKLSVELDISERSIRRILKVDLGLRPYKKIIEPALSDDQKKHSLRTGFEQVSEKKKIQKFSSPTRN